MADTAKWYVVHTYSGYENKVAANLEKLVENRRLQDYILEVDVWDIHNDKFHSLVSPGEYSYCLYEENGELFVRRDTDRSSYMIILGQGEKGRLRIDGNNLKFVPADNNN